MRIKPYYYILLVLNLLSIFFILQIELNFFGLFESSFNKKVIESINALVVNLSIGMLLSTLFFIIVVLLPELLKKKSTLSIIQPRLNTIGDQVNQQLHYIVFKRLSLKPKSIKKLKAKDFQNIDGLTDKKMSFNYEILGSHGEWVKIGTGDVTEYESFSNHRKLIVRKIDEIFSLPTITQVDDELIEILARIRDCQFFGTIEAYDRFGISLINETFNNGIYEYYKLHKRFKKYYKAIPFKVRE